MRRREIVTGLAGAALFGSTAWAQKPGRPKLIGVLTGTSENNPPIQSSIKNFRQALQSRGWREGDSVQVIYRFAAGAPARVQMFATEFVRLQPDVIVAHTGSRTVIAHGGRARWSRTVVAHGARDTAVLPAPLSARRHSPRPHGCRCPEAYSIRSA